MPPRIPTHRIRRLRCQATIRRKGKSCGKICDAIVTGVIAPGVIRLGNGKTLIVDLCNWECHNCGRCETVAKDIGYLSPDQVVIDDG